MQHTAIMALVFNVMDLNSIFNSLLLLFILFYIHFVNLMFINRRNGLRYKSVLALWVFFVVVF